MKKLYIFLALFSLCKINAFVRPVGSKGLPRIIAQRVEEERWIALMQEWEHQVEMERLERKNRRLIEENRRAALRRKERANEGWFRRLFFGLY